MARRAWVAQAQTCAHKIRFRGWWQRGSLLTPRTAVRFRPRKGRVVVGSGAPWGRMALKGSSLRWLRAQPTTYRGSGKGLDSGAPTSCFSGNTKLRRMRSVQPGTRWEVPHLDWKGDRGPRPGGGGGGLALTRPWLGRRVLLVWVWGGFQQSCSQRGGLGTLHSCCLLLANAAPGPGLRPADSYVSDSYGQVLHLASRGVRKALKWLAVSPCSMGGGVCRRFPRPPGLGKGPRVAGTSGGGAEREQGRWPPSLHSSLPAEAGAGGTWLGAGVSLWE